MWSVVNTIIWLLLYVCSAQGAANASATPLSVSPSEYWDGNDGWWSTFWIEVGTPGQTIKVLPATSASAGDTTWVIIPEGCTIANPTLEGCGSLRGRLFYANESSSWTLRRPDTSQPLANDGLFQLITVEESQLGLTGNAYYGFDTIQLGLQGSSHATVQHQLIAGIGSNDFWIGTLGLSPLAFNFSNFGNPIPSLLSTLRDEGHIPSISWSYTAGAHYLDPPVFGSLTLGGYDGSQFSSATALRNIPFGTDISRDLLVDLRTVTYDTNGGKGSLLGESIHMFIDSMVTQIWLPIDACKRFEQAFSLTWNATAQFYFVSDETHSALMAQNPTITFTFGSGDRTVDIVLPYAAFDFILTAPLVNDTARYFPLKRANDSTQYTLGRVFLQEAYIVADYSRQNFTIAQASHPSAAQEQDLLPIVPPGTESKTSKGNTLGPGAIAGIVLGIILGLLIIVTIGIWLWIRRRNRRNARLSMEPLREETILEKTSREDAAAIGEEIDGTPRYEMESNENSPELQGGKFVQELDARERIHELEGTPVK